ncbi:alanine racemase C-terminal domain-containing protein [Microbacterium sp. M3]|uniref:Alanine racemase C-terminal domain-containing protein n=1 Tax=Microbacterium arthrosphaerae TaxID=792652 RepID=A0ABU4GZR2_9MICO|nr:MULTISPECIES: alanine racemase C-terminal domain-containing protein [Microbacterium]MDW4572576.1 alanine racemase C-terminal domain-containing protein [Microbacterium arthrosphaerae]MDW7606431.1 alanine racemase C-terminal domain-containing protein [Microbacterium sp. M3]
MSSSIPGHAASTPGTGPRSTPVARVSRGALTSNARAARARGIRSFSPEVLEADAWGHGAALAREVLAAEGFAVVGNAAAGLPAPEEAALEPAELFGLPPASGSPALRLTGTVLSVKDLRRGEGVSYGYAYRAPDDTRVALVTGGYAQGVVRALGGAADVVIAGERHPIVGRVAMDVCVVEIGDATVTRGDEVVFLGDPGRGEPGLAEWVRATGLAADELVTTVGLRAHREDAP